MKESCLGGRLRGRVVRYQYSPHDDPYMIIGVYGRSMKEGSRIVPLDCWSKRLSK